MERTEFVALLDRQVKLVRTEYGLNQEVMARVLGISKKTLVEIEKGRTSLGWTGAVALCAIFSGSQVLSGVLGGEAGELIRALAFQDLRPTYPKTLGGKVWWRFVETLGHHPAESDLPALPGPGPGGRPGVLLL